MNLARRAFVPMVLAAMACGATAVAVQAQTGTFPAKPIKLIVPFDAGGTGDVVARALAERAGADLGQPIVVENRSGGGGAIGAQAALRAPADGYTILQIATSHVILPSMQRNTGYDLDRDFQPMFGINLTPQAVVVNGRSGARTMADLAGASRGSASGLNFGSGGIGSLSQLTGSVLIREMKIKATHVPFRGLSGAVQAVLGNNVDFAVLNMPEVIKLAAAGDLRVLAVTSDQRLPYMPDVPTVTELGYPAVTSSSWNAYLVATGTPPEITDRLQRAFARAAADPGLQQRLLAMNVSINSLTGADLRKHMQTEAARWKRVVEENQIKIDN